MNLIERQLLETKEVTKYYTSSFCVVVLGQYRKDAVKSVENQMYSNHNVVELDIYEKWNENDKNLLCDTIKNVEQDYLIFLKGHDTLTSNALLEYARYLDREDCDVVYADECTYTDRAQNNLVYFIKPKAEPIAYLQNMYMGNAICFRTSCVKELIDDVESEYIDSTIKELFYKILANDGLVGNVPLVLCKKVYESRSLDDEKRISKYLKAAIKVKRPEWKGELSKAKSYNPFSWELQAEENIETEFIVFSSNAEETNQLLSQIRISYSDAHVIIVAHKKDYNKIRESCDKFDICNVEIAEKCYTYNESLTKVKQLLICDNQIVISDSVRWLNRMNVETLKQCFFKQDVSLAVPQIATEGDEPKLIYGGDDIDSLALTGNYYCGRPHGVCSEYDLQWINRRVTSINQYVFLIRKELWDVLLPIDTTIKSFRQFAIELSLKCMKMDIICEYSAQSCFWIKKEVLDYYKSNGESEILGWEDEPRLSGSFIHWLTDYAEYVGNVNNIPYASQSYRPYIRERFKAYNLECLKEQEDYSKCKRVLVVTHELSLSGAPIVLVQAVAELIKMGYQPIVVSPVDGPLKKEYKELNVPVIIEPRLYENFEYVHVAYDFDFVLACTICLWQVVEQLGKTDIPVLWWIHDSEMGYKNYLRYVLPDDMPDNIHIYAGGEYAQRVLKKYRPKYNVEILLYGLEDFALSLPKTVGRTEWNLPEDKLVFANIAQIISRKGQDIMVAAIRNLPMEVIEKCVFVFVGGVADRKIYNEIIALQEEFPNSVKYIKQIPHSILREFYREIDGVICSSTDDPLPAFVTEAMMMSDVCICSRNTAFNTIIDDGVNGYLFESGDVVQLSTSINEVVKNEKNLNEIKSNARSLFLKTFGLEIFADNLKNVVDEILN